MEIAGQLVRIPVSRVQRFEKQPRKYFDRKTLEDLAISIMHDGQQVPIKVMEDPTTPGNFILIDGERRWRAHNLIWKESGKEPSILAMIEPVADFAKHMEASFVSNLHRDDMAPMDVAEAFLFLKERGTDHDGKRYTIDKIGKLSGKSPLYVMNYLKLNKLPQAVRDMMSLDLPKKSRLSVTIAIEIASSTNDPSIMEEIARTVVESEFTIKETRYFIASQFDGQRIVSRDKRDYAAERENQTLRMRVNGKYVDPKREFKKLQALTVRVGKDFEISLKSLDFDILLGYCDDPEKQADELSRSLMHSMQFMFAIKEKLDRISKGG